MKLPESLPPERRGKVRFRRFATTREALVTLRHPALGPLILLFFIITFAFANVEVSFPLYAKFFVGLSETGVYSIFIVVGLIMAFIQGYFIRKAVKFIPEQIWIILGCATLMLGAALLPLRPSNMGMLVPMCILAAGHGICVPCLMSLISRQARAHLQGNVLGTSQAASTLGRILGPLGGVIYDAFGPQWPFWIAAVVMLFAVYWANVTRWRLIRHRAQTDGAEPD